MDIPSKDIQTKDFFSQGWDAVSVEDVLGATYQPRSLEVFSLIRRHLPSQAKVLEAGCGLGNMVILFKRNNYDIYGVDYIISALKKAKDYDNSLRLAAGNILSLPYPDGSFQAYLSFGVMEHFEEGPLGALNEANRVLANAGQMVMSVPYPNLLTKLTIGKIETPLDKVKRNSFVRKLCGKKPRVGFYKPPYAAVFSVDDIRTMFIDSGFSLEYIYPINHSYNLYSLSKIFRKNELGIENKLCLVISDVLKRIAPWSTCLMSLAIGKKVRNV